MVINDWWRTDEDAFSPWPERKWCVYNDAFMTRKPRQSDYFATKVEADNEAACRNQRDRLVKPMSFDELDVLLESAFQALAFGNSECEDRFLDRVVAARQFVQLHIAYSKQDNEGLQL